MLTDLIQETIQVLRLNTKRTALTGLAVAWGILMLIVLLGASNGLIHGFEQNMGDAADNVVRVYSGRTSIPWNGLSEGRYIGLEERDLGILADALRDNVEAVSATIYGNDTVQTGENSVPINFMGIAPAHQKISKTKMLHGRFVNELDMRQRRKVVVLSQRAAEVLYDRPERAMGRTVSIAGLAFRVVGVTDGSKDREQRAQCFAPYTTYAATHDYDGHVHRIDLTTRGLITPEENEAFNRRVRSVMAQAHNFSPDDPNAIWLWNMSEMREGNDMAKNVLHLTVWVIGILTLISGIVGVSNITFVSVKERTHEIGIRRAIGARPRNIYIMVLTESVTITALFGMLGLLLGVALTQVAAHNMEGLMFEGQALFTDPTVGLDICLEAFATMVLSGLLAGLFPAYKATKVNPVEALSDE